MKIGDIVRYNYNILVPGDDLTGITAGQPPTVTGIVIGFNEKGEGGQHYVHLLRENGSVEVRMAHMLEVITEQE